VRVRDELAERLRAAGETIAQRNEVRATNRLLLEQHPLEQHPVCGLYLGTLGNRHPGRPQALGQLVAHALELAEPEQSRLAPMLWRLIETTHPVCGHECLRQLALEALDL